MRISDLATELGLQSKEIMDFLRKEFGGDYKSHFKGLNDSEESSIRSRFKGGVLTAKEPKAAKKTLIRKRGAKRSFIPSDERVEVEETTPPPAESVPEVEVESQDEPAVETAAPVAAPKTLSPEEIALMELQQEEALEAQKEAAKDAKPTEDGEKKGEKKAKPVIVNITDDDIPLPAEKPEPEVVAPAPPTPEDLHKRHKKKVVLHPESQESHANAHKKSKKGGRRNDSQDRNRHAKVKGGTIVADDFGRGRKRFKKKNRKQKVAVPANPTKAIKMIVKVEDSIILSELAHRMAVKSSQVIGKLMQMGEMATLNDRLPYETALLLAEEFGFQVQNVAISEETFVETVEVTEDNMKTRPPVVTVMGHVDHGKTRLLDTIRNTNIIDKEAGGITQHIGAYSIDLDGNLITFLDTPGHEAFTAMRSRGTQATDVVILIVAADDGVMPQTVEAINHAKAAGVPIIVAINKIDKPDANPQKVRNELLQYEIVAEELGGEHLFVEISAKENINIQTLLETILLQVEILELQANPDKLADGLVIESRMDTGLGPVATTLVRNGTLKVGDLIVVGTSMGFVRSMTDWTGHRVKEAPPSMAVEITGLDSVPSAGEKIYAFKDDQKAKGLVEWRKKQEQEKKFEAGSSGSGVTLDNLFEQINEGNVEEVNIIVKADVDGSVDAIVSMLNKIEHDKMKVRIIHKGVGGITENDILLAAASQAIVVGFNVRMDSKAKQTAVKEQVEVKQFSIIYDLIDSIKAALTGRLAPIIKEEYSGTAEIKQIFKVAKIGSIAGCMVTEGKIVKASNVKVIRNNVVVYEGKLSSLKRFQQDADEVKAGFECGLMIENYNDIKEGDTVECFRETEIKDEVK
ncbi:translation initiation factor IF-2 [bacterium]|nr:translation initiation factor IF-2 [bacterium]